MSATSIGPTIGVNGVDQYKKDLDSAKAATKAFKAELDGAAKIKDPFASATASSTALGKEIAAQQIYIKGLTEKYGEAVQKYGAYSKQAFNAQEDLAKANKALSSMMQQYEKIGTKKITIPGIGDFKRDIETLTQSTKTFKAEFQAISSGFGIEGAFKRASESSDKLKNSIETQKTTVKLLQEDYDKVAKEQGEFSKGAMEAREKVANATTELNNMKKTLRDLPNGLQNVAKEFEELSKKTSAIASGFDKAAKPAMAFSKTYAAAMIPAVKVSMDYEQQMAKVAAVSGFTDKQMQGLNAEILKMAQGSIHGPQKLAEGLEVIGRAGIKDAADQISVLNAGMNLATAEGKEFAEMADGLISVLYTYGYSMKSAGDATDLIAQASRSAKTDASEMFQALEQAGPSMASLNFTLSDTALALDLIADRGVTGAKAGTYLKSAFANLTSPTDKQKEAMDKYGISLDNGNGKSASFIEVLTQMRESFGGFDVELEDANGELKDADSLFEELSGSLPTEQLEKLQGVVDIFGKRSLPAMLAMINASPERFEELKDAMANAKDTASEMADIVADSTKGGWQKLLSGLQVLGIELGNQLLPFINKLLVAATGLVTKFSEMDEGTKKLIVVGGGILALVGPILKGTGGLFRAISDIQGGIGGLVSAFGGIQKLVGGGAGGGGLLGGIKTLVAGFLALPTPMKAVIAVGAGLVAGAVLIYKNWDKLNQFGAELWEGLKYGWRTGVESLKESGKNLVTKLDSLSERASKAAREWAEGFTAAAKTTVDSIRNSPIVQVGGAVLKALVKTTDEKLATIKRAYENHGGGIKGVVAATMTAVKESWTFGLEVIRKFTDEILKSMSDKMSAGVKNALTWGRDMIDNFVKGIKEKVAAVAEAAKGIAKTVKDILGFSVPEKGPLADADTYMPDFIDLLVSGLRRGTHLIEAASNDIAKTLTLPSYYADLPDVSGSNTTTNLGGVNIVINAPENMDIEELAETVEERLSNLIVRREAAYA